MARIPRKEVGWTHEVEPPPEDSRVKLWTVWGPALSGGPVHCGDQDAAETVAAALNLAHNFRYIQARVNDIANAAEYFQEFK